MSGRARANPTSKSVMYEDADGGVDFDGDGFRSTFRVTFWAEYNNLPLPTRLFNKVVNSVLVPC